MAFVLICENFYQNFNLILKPLRRLLDVFWHLDKTMQNGNADGMECKLFIGKWIEKCVVCVEFIWRTVVACTDMLVLALKKPIIIYQITNPIH